MVTEFIGSNTQVFAKEKRESRSHCFKATDNHRTCIDQQTPPRHHLEKAAWDIDMSTYLRYDRSRIITEPESEDEYEPQI